MVGVGGLLYGDENKRNASASIEMTCTLLDSLLGGDSRGSSYVSALCRLQPNSTTTAKIKILLGRLFSCKVLPSRQRGQVFPSLIFPLLCVIHFVLFEPGGL